MLPLSDAQETKWRALEKVIDYRVLGSAERGSTGSTERFRLSAPTRPALLNGALFQARLPLRIGRQIIKFEPDAIMCGDPFICAAALVARRCETGDAGDRRGHGDCAPSRGSTAQWR